MKFFIQHFFEQIKVPLRGEILSQLSKDRNSQQIDRDTLKKCINAYVLMGLGLAKP
jgi:hypothetical protein